MQSRNRFIIAGLVLALGLFAVQAASAQPRPGKTANQPGWLGVSIQDVTGDIKEAMPRGVTDGAIVNSVVEDSPAEKTGLKEGDIITRFNGTDIHDADDLTAAVRDAGSGTRADIQYYRDGRLMRDRVTLTEPVGQADVRRPRSRDFKWVQKDDDEDADNESDNDEPGYDGNAWIFHDGNGPMEFLLNRDRPARLGVRLMDLGDQLAAYFKVDSDGGVLITEVVEGSAAAKAGLQAGDVIVAVGEQAVSDASDVTEEIGRHEEAGPVSIKVVRNGRSQTVTAELEKRQSRRFGMREGRMPRFHFDGEPNMRGFVAPPTPDINRGELKDQMRELRQELEDLRNQLDEMRSSRR
jgi:membrane-associated protease RseP (regulator of RpoE activity)